MPSYDSILASYWIDAAKKLRALIERPAGMAPASEWTRARVNAQLAQISRILETLKIQSRLVTGRAIIQSAADGRVAAQKMLDEIKPIIPPGADVFKPSFALIDPKTVEIIARDAAQDANRVIDSTQRAITRTLHKMADNGLTVEQVNQTIARGVITGDTRAPMVEIRDQLRAIAGETITVIDKNGDPINFDAGYYAKMLVRTRTREAVVRGRHERLAESGIDLVTIVGRVSKNFCTAYLGRVFSLSGQSDRYPAITGLPSDGPPFHPNCSKSTAPFIDALESKKNQALGEMDATDPMLATKNTTELQRTFKDLQEGQSAAARQKSIVDDIRRRAAAAGYKVPAWSPAGGQS